MRRMQLPCLILVEALVCVLGATAQAQLYGGGLYGGGLYGGGLYGGGFNGGGLYGGGYPGGGYPGGYMSPGFAPPLQFGGYYPPAYGMVGPYGGAGYGAGFGYNSSIYGFVPPGYVPNAGAGSANPYAGYPGFGWWPLFASDMKVTAISARDFQRQSSYVPGIPSTNEVLRQQSATSSRSTVIHTGADIKLTCPKTVGTSLTYSLNGTVYTIHPGYSQGFQDDRTWKLEFRRTADAADIVGYTLKPGTYNFAIGSSGWELRQVVKVPAGDLLPAPQPMPLDAPTPGEKPST